MLCPLSLPQARVKELESQQRQEERAEGDSHPAPVDQGKVNRDREALCCQVEVGGGCCRTRL